MSNKQETIIRAKHGGSQHYFIYARATPQDERLSWEARGVISYLLSKPDDWVVIAKDLEQNCGRDKVSRILKELIKFGYLEKRKPIRDEKTGKITGYTPHTIHEVPVNTTTTLETRNTVNQTTVNQTTAKPILHNTDIQNTDKKKKDMQQAADDNSTHIEPVQEPDKTEQQKEKDNAFELSQVIPNLLGLHNGREWNIAHMLTGTSKKNGYKDYTQYFKGDNRVIPDELKKVVAYYREKHPDADIIQSPEIIADWVGKYRQYEAEQQELRDTVGTLETTTGHVPHETDISDFEFDNESEQSFSKLPYRKQIQLTERL